MVKPPMCLYYCCNLHFSLCDLLLIYILMFTPHLFGRILSCCGEHLQDCKSKYLQLYLKKKKSFLLFHASFAFILA